MRSTVDDVVEAALHEDAAERALAAARGSESVLQSQPVSAGEVLQTPCEPHCAPRYDALNITRSFAR